jgi:hypothetical protein
MQLGEVASMPLDGLGELNRTGGRPVLLPVPLSLLEVLLAKIMVARGGGERGLDFGISQTAGDSGITAIPQLSRELAARLLDHELHQRAGIEVDDGHP